jgi:hypothetical protein
MCDRNRGFALNKVESNDFNSHEGQSLSSRDSDGPQPLLSSGPGKEDLSYGIMHRSGGEAPGGIFGNDSSQGSRPRNARDEVSSWGEKNGFGVKAKAVKVSRFLCNISAL